MARANGPGRGRRSLPLGPRASGIRAVVSHDSYLINLATPDETLRAKSVRAFTGELERCRAFGIPWVVSHPG